MAEVVKIHGLDGVRTALKRLPKEVARNELFKALRPGARLIKAQAQALAPRGEGFYRRYRGKEWAHYAGTLRNSIAIRREKKKFLLDAARLRIGVLSNRRNINIGAFYWRFVEFGTSKMPAKPFLTPAFEMMKYAADSAIKRALVKGVIKQAKKVRQR